MLPVNAPNVLTVVRILLVPVSVVALLNETDHGDLLAAIAFALASLTDAIDGHLARRRKAVTTFGKLMDPVADKQLIVAGPSRSCRWAGCGFFAIACDPTPVRVDLIFSRAVGIRVISGIDYSFGLRRLMREAQAR